MDVSSGLDQLGGVALIQIFETSAWVAGTAWGLSPRDLSSSSWLNWASLYGGGKTLRKQQERASPNVYMALQASVCFTFADIPLAKVSHTFKFKVNMGRGDLKVWITGSHYHRGRPQPSAPVPIIPFSYAKYILFLWGPSQVSFNYGMRFRAPDLVISINSKCRWDTSLSGAPLDPKPVNETSCMLCTQSTHRGRQRRDNHGKHFHSQRKLKEDAQQAWNPSRLMLPGLPCWRADAFHQGHSP